MTSETRNIPPKRQPRITAATRIRQLYWCRFPEDAELPELWKTRPVIVISKKRELYGAVTVIPCTTSDQAGNKWAYELNTTIDGETRSWAICDKPCTVAVSRLTPDRNGIRRITDTEFHGVLDILYKWLPVLPTEQT